MKKVKLEAVLQLPEGMLSSIVIAAVVNALEGLPGGEKIKIEKLIFG